MEGVRGELGGFAGAYTQATGGSSKLTRSVDVQQLAAAMKMVSVATSAMQQQFGAHMTIFNAVG